MEKYELMKVIEALIWLIQALTIELAVVLHDIAQCLPADVNKGICMLTVEDLNGKLMGHPDYAVYAARHCQGNDPPAGKAYADGNEDYLIDDDPALFHRYFYLRADPGR